jgi:hypothetical protein
MNKPIDEADVFYFLPDPVSLPETVKGGGSTGMKQTSRSSITIPVEGRPASSCGYASTRNQYNPLEIKLEGEENHA